MSGIHITLNQLYVGVIEALPNALGIEGSLSWEEVLKEALNNCVFSLKHDNTFLSEDVVETEKILIEKALTIPDIFIIDYSEEKE